MRILVALLGGLLFGLGLALSNMMDPAKVLSFLDLAGQWDPSLMLVMGGAVATTLPGFYLILKRPYPLFEKKFYLPGSNMIDRNLIVGAALFGLGWALAGLCPGPAVAGLASANGDIIAFVIAMLAGYRLMAMLQSRSAS